MKALKVYEAFEFERGRDPIDAMGIGSKLFIWDKFLALRERCRSDWMTFYAIYSSNDGSFLKIYGEGPKFKTNTNRILKEWKLDEYIELPGEITERQSHSVVISYPIKPQYKNILKDFESSKYIGKKSVFEALDFKRGNHHSEILDRLTDQKFRPGRIFTYKRSYGDGSRAMLMYLGDDSELGRFLKIGQIMKTEKNGISGPPFYAFYSPHLLLSWDKNITVSKDTVREPEKEELDLYLKRSQNPSPAFLNQLEEIKRITGMYPFI
jgi:hypothetical protein